MRRSTFIPTTFALAMASAAVTASAVVAQERSCGARFRFIWGQSSEGRLATPAGIPCRVNLAMAGNSTVAHVQIVRGPRNGMALPGVAGTIRYQPQRGFIGEDSMVVRYVGTGSALRRSEATVTFAITVF